MTRLPETGTWHYGLIARYWDEFNAPAEEELAYYKRAIERFGQPALDVEGTHELDARRSYRTAFMCGVFGIGGSRSNDFAALRRVHDVLAPGGTLLIDHEFPYDTDDVDAWARWLPGHRNDFAHGTVHQQRAPTRR